MSCFALARFLTRHGLSQQGFADRLGIHQSQLSRLLSGERRCSADMAHAISEATFGQVRFEDLWSPQPPRSRKPARPAKRRSDRTLVESKRGLASLPDRQPARRSAR